MCLKYVLILFIKGKENIYYFHYAVNIMIKFEYFFLGGGRSNFLHEMFLRLCNIFSMRTKGRMEQERKD